MDATETTVRDLLKRHGRLGVDIAELKRTDDLYGAGLTSHASVDMMLAWEDDSASSSQSGC